MGRLPFRLGERSVGAGKMEFSPSFNVRPGEFSGDARTTPGEESASCKAVVGVERALLTVSSSTRMRLLLATGFDGSGAECAS